MRRMEMSKKKRPDAVRTNLQDRKTPAAKRSVVCSLPVSMPFGFACTVTVDGRLHAVEWETSLRRLTRVLSSKYHGFTSQRERGGTTEALLESYAGGRIIPRERIQGIRFAWERVRPFSRRVLRELAKVPYGASVSYGELAARCGRPGAARAVGSVLSRNPWPILLPCHRVIGAGGQMVGFGKGTRAKEILIRFEKERVDRGGNA